MGTVPESSRTAASPQVIELRQYTLHPGQRDVLIALFEREFVEPQQALGMPVIGSFTDLDDADRFVWLRGFSNMASRAPALEAFYGGPDWQRHRSAANATMVDSDNVLLLRPAFEGGGFANLAASRLPAADERPPAGLVTATICPLVAPPGQDLAALFEHSVLPAWTAAGAEVIACLATEPAPNNFPRLPVREGEAVWVWLSRFADPAAQQRHAEGLAACDEWRGSLWPALRERLAAEPQTLRLLPTPGSALRG